MRGLKTLKIKASIDGSMGRGPDFLLGELKPISVPLTLSYTPRISYVYRDVTIPLLHWVNWESCTGELYRRVSGITTHYSED